MSRVELVNVGLSAVGGGQLLHDLDLTADEGEFLVLLGDQRSARAVLKAVKGDGDVSIDRGTVRIDSRVVNEVPGGERDVAALSGSDALSPDLTVAQNLIRRLASARLPAPERQRRVNTAAAELGLTPLLDRKLEGLSGGERQVVALLAGFLRDQGVLVQLDANEAPLATLAERWRELSAVLDETGPAALTVAQSARGLDPALSVAVMGAGRLLQRGVVSEVRAAPANLAVAAAVADEPLVVVPGILEHGRIRVGPHLIDVPGLQPVPRATGPRPLDVVVGSSSLLGPDERPGPEAAVIPGVLHEGLDSGVRRLDLSRAGQGEVQLAIDPAHVQLFEPGGGFVPVTRLPIAGESVTLVAPPSAAGSEPSPAEQRRTYVNVGFAAADDARHVVEPSHLDPGERLWLWVEIGPRVEGAISGDVQPMDPEVVKDLDEVEVVLFPDEGLSLAPDPPLARLGMTNPGPFRVRQAAAVPPEAGPMAGHRLFFTLTAPEKPGDYRVRCAVYAKGLLLHVEQLTVVVGPSRHSTSARTTFRLVRDIAAVDHGEIREHRLSIYANAQPDGSHDFSFRGADGQRLLTRQLRLDDSTVGNSLRLAREALHRASWGSDNEYAGQSSRYDKYPAVGFAPGLAAADLIDLARWGYYLWVRFAKKLPGDEDAAAQGPAVDRLDELRTLMRAPGGAVQLAPIEEPDRIVPIHLFYDRPLDADNPKALMLCSSGAAWIGSSEDELPCLEGCSEPDDDTRVCPAGFWGLRHSVAVTPSPEDVCHQGLPGKVSRSNGLRGIAGFTTDTKVLGAAAGHEARIAALLKVDRVVYSREEFKADLETVPAQVLYFLCHVGDHKRNPHLVLGPTGGPGIGYTTLVDLWKPRLCSARPLVVLNACNSAAPSPERLLSLVRGFLERGAAGAIGTEVTVFVSLAAPFAEHFAQSFVSGVALGEAIRRARVAMLAKGNPLGLAYLAFGLPQLELVSDELIPPVPEGSAS